MTSCKATQLPFEILSPIKSQVACAGVCKSWHSPANQSRYAHVDVDIDQFNESKCIETLTTMSAGAIVRSITLLKYNMVNQEQFMTLLNSCPNIVSLKLDSQSGYMQWIYENRNTVKLDSLKKLILEPREGRFINRDYEKYYYELVYQYRESITEIEIDNPKHEIIRSLSFGTILTFIPQFANLKKLTISNCDQEGGDAIYLCDILNVCPHLESITLKLGYPLYDPSKDSNTYQEQWPNLTKLDILLPKFSLGDIRCIAQRFPNLDDLTVKTTHHDKNEEMVRGVDIQEYISYISKLSKSCVDIKIDDQSSVKDFISLIYYSKKDNVKIKQHFSVENNPREETKVVASTTRKSNDLIITLKYALVRDIGPELPYEYHFDTYGSQINSLTISLGVMEHGVNLDPVLRKCRNLASLEVNTLNRNTSATRVCFDNVPSDAEHDNLTSLTFDGTIITSALLQNVSIYASNITKLKILNCLHDEPSGKASVWYKMNNLNLEYLDFGLSFAITRFPFVAFF